MSIRIMNVLIPHDGSYLVPMLGARFGGHEHNAVYWAQRVAMNAARSRTTFHGRWIYIDQQGRERQWKHPQARLADGRHRYDRNDLIVDCRAAFRLVTTDALREAFAPPQRRTRPSSR